MGGTAIPAGASIGDLTGSSPAPATLPPSGGGAIPPGATVGSVADDVAPPRSFDDPRVGKLGYYINGDGSTVIAPKDGEDYQATVQRAIAHFKSLTPEQQTDQLNRDASSPIKKTAGTLATAAGIGVAGPALLAVPNEAGALAKWLTSAPLGLQTPIQQAIPHLITTAKILGGLGISASVAHTLLKEFMGTEK